MKQKFALYRDDAENKLLIREYAELDKEVLSLLCEESYEHRDVEDAIDLGLEKLMSVLRTKNMYPPRVYAAQIAEAVISLYQSDKADSAELYFDDIEVLTRPDAEEELAKIEADGEDIDDLLEDEGNSDLDEDLGVKKLNPSFKVADDEAADTDDDV